MNQKERLALCSGCIRRKLDYEHGYVCQLTGKFADFKDECKHYQRDSTVSNTIKVETEEPPFIPLFEPAPGPKRSEIKKKAVKRTAVKKPAARKQAVNRPSAKNRPPSEVALKKLRKYQSFLYALPGGLLVMLVSVLAWVYVSSVYGYGEVYMALGMGFLVGVAVRYFGAGLKWIFGILAALLALAGSFLGYYLAQNAFLEDLKLAAIVRLLDYLSPELIRNSIQDTLVPLDLLFYGLAAVLAYFLAIRRINKSMLFRLEVDGYKGAPPLYWLRLPLILAGILVPAYFGYTYSSQDAAGFNTLYYDSGEKMSEGMMLKGQETGEWTSWYENGNIKSIGNFTGGKKDSLWRWYDENGILTGTGMYVEGTEHGTWMNYYPGGMVSDSGSYLEGLKEGPWEYFHENGSLKYAVNFKSGKMDGEKILLSPSGQVVKVDYFENGMLIEKDE